VKVQWFYRGKNVAQDWRHRDGDVFDVDRDWYDSVGLELAMAKMSQLGEEVGSVKVIDNRDHYSSFFLGACRLEPFDEECKIAVVEAMLTLKGQ